MELKAKLVFGLFAATLALAAWLAWPVALAALWAAWKLAELKKAPLPARASWGYLRGKGARRA